MNAPHYDDKQPLVSFIIPTYNTKTEYLEQCFASFSDCHDPRIELIVADDGSSDTTLSVLQRLTQQCTVHAELIRRPKNGGQNAARNTGISHAHGRYIAFLDSDDRIDMVEMDKVITAIEANNHADMFLYSCATVDEHGKISRRVNAASNRTGLLDPHEVIQTVSELWCCAIERTLLTRYGLYEGIPIGEDLVSIVPVIAAAHTIIGVNAYPYQYVQHENSMMHVTPLSKRMLIMKGLDDMFAAHPDLLERFHDELEWVGIWHLLFWEPLQVLQSSDASHHLGELKQFQRWMKHRFPSWKRNGIMQTHPDAQNLRFKLIVRGRYHIYLFLSAMKSLVQH